ncbi:MAG: hypothetical protein OJF49_004347 [Ktedonobacterales bacterium]|nr:MAG: hypothetical protein OJF49_004347 [Ktedonobacterales bacterium]
MRGWLRWMGGFLSRNRVAVALALILTSLLPAGWTVKSAYLDPPPPIIVFAQLPWARDTTWTYQTGPHNYTSRGDLRDGLDFVAPGTDRTVRAVDTGVIVFAQYSPNAASCADPGCAGDANYVIERVRLASGAQYLVTYWHLASVAVYQGQPVDANDAIGSEGHTGFSIPATFDHLFLEVTDVQHVPVHLEGGRVSFGGWVASGSDAGKDGVLVRNGTAVYAVNDDPMRCPLASQTTGSSLCSVRSV